MPRLRVCTYNVHKCRGMDRRVRPERIAGVLRELDADIIALQEVIAHGGDDAADQARFLATQLGYHLAFGENRRHFGAAYGNATLSRCPIVSVVNHDITWRHCEHRGALRTDIAAPGATVHVFNLHMGTAYIERRFQARQLLSDRVLLSPELVQPRIVLGDFNEWTRGLATRMLRAHFQSVEHRSLLRRKPAFPGLLPLMHLDNIYFDSSFELVSFRVHRSRLARVASDHLPLVAEFQLMPPQQIR